MKQTEETLAKVLLGLGLIALLGILLGLPLQLLWNWLMPTIFNLPTITFWQAMGLNILASILFKDNSIKTNDK
jgi:hypothetical protein